MATLLTPNHNIPYPDPTTDLDPPRGDLQLEAFAEATEREMAALVPDTGTRIATDAEVTPGPDFEFLVREYRAVGRRCALHLQLKRTGPVIKGSGDPSSYNIAGDPTLATIVLGALRPVILQNGLYRANLTSGAFAISPTNGVISIYDMHYDSEIAAPSSDGDYHSIQIYAFYPIAAPIIL